MPHSKAFLKRLEADRSEIVGRILKHLRKKVNLTQQELAKKIGIAQQTYAGYEKGKHEPSIEILIILADLYGISMDLITGRDYTSDDIEGEFDRLLEISNEYYAGQRASAKQFIEMAKKQ